ncbi:hypothetical protein [Litoreibacter arenae]|uniref:Uncharacterized protein n=1 Tax=Litoreibacter arenae DSM 19593 TaxID=1123360 RepID=S9RUH0_9RHOB|nr:hypothetical protein [Litoreibacter arenae]EPX77574.1 hypothetical protein thalar_03299 [Litoreibacter arenae DSM 19593]
MTKQTLLWTVVPHGRVPKGEDGEGRLRVSAVVSPRLTPETAAEQSLAAFPDFLDWPALLEQAEFALRIGGQTLKLRPLGKPDSGLWRKLLTDTTPVAGFEFKDMSAVNLHSFAVKHMLGTLRKHYGRLAVQAASNHPTLLPWEDAHPDLKDMLDDLGTKTIKYTFGDREIEVPLPGFSRFYDDERSVGERLTAQVFGPRSVYRTDIPAIDAKDGQLPPKGGTFRRRVMSPDWYNPRPSGPGGTLLAAPDAALMDQFSSQAEYTLYQADSFYRREPATMAQKAMRFPTYQNVPPPPPIPEYDFHRILASYGSYPPLQRALGLVIDFVVEGQTPDPGAGQINGNMALVVKWQNGRDDSDDAYPATAWQLDRERFVARPRGDDLTRGLLRLENSDDSWGQQDKEEGLFDIYQVDPDGGALKTVGFTLTAQNLVAKSLDLARPDGQVTYTTGDRQPVAALRSGGLGISRHGRAQQVADDAAAAQLKNQAIAGGNGKNVVFFAEDLFRGYRVDVAAVAPPWDTAVEVKPEDWRTLCARHGTYKLIDSGDTLDFGVDEGHVAGPSASSGTSAGVNPDDYYLHESLFRWTGWSLSAPRPGKTIRAAKVDGTELQGEMPADISDVGEKGNGLAVTYKVPKGSLPKLRFGQHYRLRARYVDVAGNSLALDDPTLDPLEQATDVVGYWRFEPVDPPAIMGRNKLSEGESLERMVIRSDYDQTPETYVKTPQFTAAIIEPALSDFEYTALNERHLVPPKSAQQQCETHGLFDPYFAQWDNIKTGYEIAAREDGTLFDEIPGATVEIVTPTSVKNVAQTQNAPPALPTPENPVGDRLVGGQYVIHREAKLVTPYLPDGAAAGIAIRALPGETIPGVTGPGTIGTGCEVVEAPNSELVIMLPHQGEWPDMQGFRIVLAEREADLTELPCAEKFTNDGAPHWNPDDRVLTLFLAKGRIARLRYASFIDKSMIGDFGLLNWAPQAGRVFVAEMAMLGCHWMLTPFRTLTLVHATQHPVCLPEMIETSIGRAAGDQFADVRCRQIRLHGPSTGKFEIIAEWHEWVDDINRPKPTREHRKGQLGEIHLPENHPHDVNLFAAMAAQIVDPARPRPPPNRHEFGDSKFRLVQYRLQATTRFREYLPPPIYADPDLVTRIGPVTEGPAMTTGADDDMGAPVLRDPAGTTDHSLIPASVAPDDPRVLYVVPTFRWTRTKKVGGVDVTRLGNGLRVWLDRPWFSSGDGELLGVVLLSENGPFTAIPDKMQTSVTQWGLDPMWDTVLPKHRTKASDFPAHVISEDIRLQEFPTEAPVAIVGHRVHWDDTRALWYCDIELNPGGTYMPFVRLALVRYQPNAMNGIKISKVATAEFAQVLPRRRAVMSVKDGKVSVRVHGNVPVGGPLNYKVDSPYLNVSFRDDPKDTGRNRFELVLQSRDPAIDSDLAWEDTKLLDSAIVGGASGGIVVTPGPGTVGVFRRGARPAPVTRTVSTRGGGRQRLEAVIERQTGAITSVTQISDPAIWNVTADLDQPGGRPTRLMLREFERYYTDRSGNHKRDRQIFQKRFVEERLVYASVFNIPKS